MSAAAKPFAGHEDRDATLLVVFIPLRRKFALLIKALNGQAVLYHYRSMSFQFW